MLLGYKFKGHDWTELSEALSIDIPSYISHMEEDSYLLNKTKEKLCEARINLFLRENTDSINIIKLVRRFLEAVREESRSLSYTSLSDIDSYQLATFLLNIENEDRLLDLTAHLLGYLWT